MVRRDTLSKIFLWAFVCLLTARPALACLTVPSSAPQMAHECCRHACQHEHSERDMEHCCTQQHSASLHGDLPLITQGTQLSQFADANCLHTPSLPSLHLETHGALYPQLRVPESHAPPDFRVRYQTFLL